MVRICTTLSPLQNVHKQERLQIFWGGLKTGIPSTIEILYSSVPYQLLLTMRNTPHSIHYAKDSRYCSLALFSGLKLIESAMNVKILPKPVQFWDSKITWSASKCGSSSIIDYKKFGKLFSDSNSPFIIDWRVVFKYEFYEDLIRSYAITHNLQQTHHLDALTCFGGGGWSGYQIHNTALM